MPKCPEHRLARDGNDFAGAVYELVWAVANDRFNRQIRREKYQEAWDEKNMPDRRIGGRGRKRGHARII